MGELPWPKIPERPRGVFGSGRSGEKARFPLSSQNLLLRSRLLHRSELRVMALTVADW